jgi:flagellar basal body-associated protein FliL
LLVLALIGGGLFFYFKMQSSNNLEDTEEVTQITEETSIDKNIKKIPTQWKDSKPQFEVLGSFLVNLQNENASVDRFAQIELVIEYFSKNTLDDFKTYQPIIHNEVLIYLSQKTASTLLTPEGKTMVLNDILAILNKHLTNKDKYYINNVIFKTFIIQ